MAGEETAKETRKPDRMEMLSKNVHISFYIMYPCNACIYIYIYKRWLLIFNDFPFGVPVLHRSIPLLLPFSSSTSFSSFLSSLPQLSRLLNKWRPNPSWPPIVTVLTSDIRLNSLSARCKSGYRGGEREKKVARFPKYPPLLSPLVATSINISWKSLVDR